MHDWRDNSQKCRSKTIDRHDKSRSDARRGTQPNLRLLAMSMKAEIGEH